MVKVENGSILQGLLFAVTVDGYACHGSVTRKDTPNISPEQCYQFLVGALRSLVGFRATPPPPPPLPQDFLPFFGFTESWLYKGIVRAGEANNIDQN